MSNLEYGLYVVCICFECIVCKSAKLLIYFSSATDLGQLFAFKQITPTVGRTCHLYDERT